MIYDCFLFDNELTLLEVRLNTLASLVDKFVLVEAIHTFQGEPKPLYYDEHKADARFAPFADKIIHVVDDHEPAKETWPNERRQRSLLIRPAMQPDDLVFICDVDEIWRPEIVALCTDDTPKTLVMTLYRYAFNCQFGAWPTPVVARAKDLAYLNTLYGMRNVAGAGMITGAGWHFSYLMSPQEIADKICRFSHSEWNHRPYNDPEYIRVCIEQRIDIYTGRDCRVVPLDAPEYVMNNQARFKEFIF